MGVPRYASALCPRDFAHSEHNHHILRPGSKRPQVLKRAR
jgi:hypothetical protein